MLDATDKQTDSCLYRASWSLPIAHKRLRKKKIDDTTKCCDDAKESTKNYQLSVHLTDRNHKQHIAESLR
jgi:hypothetical protein